MRTHKYRLNLGRSNKALQPTANSAASEFFVGRNEKSSQISNAPRHLLSAWCNTGSIPFFGRDYACSSWKERRGVVLE